MNKNYKEYLEDIKKQVERAKCYEIENPTVADIKKLKDFDYIITEGKYFPVIIKRRYTIESILGIPTLMWFDGYEVGDSIMGMIPVTYTPEDILEELKGYRGEITDDIREK